MRGTIEERFWAKVDRRTPDECWPWIGSGNGRGYGILFVRKRNGLPVWVYAHRFSYELHIGPIPDKLLVMHKCDNRPCVNPAHLMTGTALENSADMIAKGRSVKSGPKGSESPRAKLNEDKVRAIRKQRAEGELLKTLAAEYGVAVGTIAKIARGRGWRHVD